jgi:hypothetical protein
VTLPPPPAGGVAPKGEPLRRILSLVVLLALVPALVLVGLRISGEGTQRTVSIVMDELALADQAEFLGLTSLELALRYRELGLTGIALYEDTLESLAGKGKIAALLGSQARAAALVAGRPLPDVPSDATLVTELEPGALDVVLATTMPPARALEHEGRTWYVWPGDTLRTRPAGPDREQIAAFVAAGFEIAYRPRNFPNLREVGAHLPEEARYLIYAGLQVTGFPHALEETAEASQERLTAIIEGTQQDGMRYVAARVPTVRLLSFNQDYVNLRLRPDDLVEKYLLAVNERNVRLLYLRPWTEERLGDMVAFTEELVVSLADALRRDGFVVAPLPLADVAYSAPLPLRIAAAVGIVAGLGLLALAFPAPWGALAAAMVALLGLLAAGPSWAALALVAALVFPVIGFAHARPGLPALFRATAVSLAGAAFLVAVGSDRATMLAIEPFAGVAATLVVPPALFAAHALLRWRRPVEWVRTLWGYPVRLGDVAVAVGVAAILGLVVMRRGNFPVIGASEAELALRSALNELFVRPRFKELVGHPLAVLALLNPRWPLWATTPLLVAGVIAQASILNSFSHYHTPVLVSLQRTAIALALGLLVGLVLVPLGRLVVRAVRASLDGGSERLHTADGD